MVYLKQKKETKNHEHLAVPPIPPVPRVFCLFQLNTNERSEMRGLIERNKRHTGYFVLIE